MDPQKTGKIIGEARKKLKLTQKELADKLCITDKAVSKWERGLSLPDISLLIPLTENLNISLYELLKGEKMNNKNVEETIKDAINYSNKEIKRNKKKYLLITIFFILIILMCSIAINIKNKQEISAYTDKDTIYHINDYTKYKTDLEDSNKNNENMEIIFMKLPLSYSERSFSVKKNNINIKYNITYKKMLRAYNDETYVKAAMIYNANILFLTINDLNSVKISFSDYTFKTSLDDVKKLYKTDNLNMLKEDKNWNNMVNKKFNDKDYTNKAFDMVFKKKESK